MGQKAISLMRYGSPKERAIELTSAIAQSRDRLGLILSELERRRRDLFDIRLQLRRNAIPLVMLVAGIGGIVALSLNMRAKRMRNERRLVARFHRARRAVSRAVRDPDRVAAPPPDLGKKVLIAVASAAATTLVTAVVKRIVEVVVVPPAREGVGEIRRAMLPARRMPATEAVRPRSQRMTPRAVARTH